MKKWLKQNKFKLSKPLPKGTDPPPHWRACLGDLHSEYDGVCAYLCIYIERAVAPPTVDHFVAKSKHAGLIYE